MSGEQSDLDRLLKARAAIDDELRRQKSLRTVLFTDVVGSTAYFDRYGDTAGLALVQRHAQIGAQAVAELGGKVIKTIGDSVMAVFEDPVAAVRAACRIQRHVYDLNETLPLRERHQLRVGVNHGQVYYSGTDVFGDAVNVAARICKHTGPAQILISQSVYENIRARGDLPCQSIGQLAFEGKTDKHDIFEVLWIDATTYTRLRERVAEIAPVAHTTPAAAETEPCSVPVPAPLQSDPLRARFEVLSELGRGGMGIVYRARDRETGETVALKVLRPELAADPAAMDRFKKELRLARKITHKNVCRIYDFHGSDTAACISMEYVEGESLRRVLTRCGKLTIPRGIEICRQICAGLREAHSQGIIHRDLKPENIMIDEAGRVKLMDFGIARLAGSATVTSATPMGTPAYMAPEQVESHPLAATTDIYALGLILFELFTGSQAFVGETPIAVAIKQVQTPPRLPTGADRLPDKVETVILKCLEKRPAQRFQSVDELEAALGDEAQPAQSVRAVQATVPMQVTSEPGREPELTPSRIPHPPSAKRRIAGWIAVCAMLAGVGWIALMRWPAPAPQPSPPAAPTSAQSTPQALSAPAVQPAPPDTVPAAPQTGTTKTTDASPQPRATNLDASVVRSPAAAPSAETRTVPPATSHSPAGAAPRAEIRRLLAGARTAVLENRDADAAAAFETVLKLDPENGQAVAGLAALKGRQLQEARDYAGAIRMFEAALARAPNDPRLKQALDRARRARDMERRSRRGIRNAP